MGAVGAGAHGEFGVAIEQDRDIAPLNSSCDRLGAVGQRALVAFLEAEQNCGDVAGVERRADITQKGCRIAELRRDQIKAAGRGRSHLAA
jgi:hypothetical protein